MNTPLYSLPYSKSITPKDDGTDQFPTSFGVNDTHLYDIFITDSNNESGKGYVINGCPHPIPFIESGFDMFASFNAFGSFVFLMIPSVTKGACKYDITYMCIISTLDVKQLDTK